MNELLSIKGVLVLFVVIAGLGALFTGNKDIALMCIGGALAIISPKSPTVGTTVEAVKDAIK